MSLNKFFDAVKAGEWGVAHGLVNFGVLMFVVFFVPSYWAVLVVAAVLAAYWWRREAVARKTWDIREWYLDSQLDAVVPLLVSMAFVLWRYLWV